MEITQLYFFVTISLAIFKTSIAMYEHVCTEKGLFTPYLHVFKGRHNLTIVFSAGPGFYDMRGHSDIYACVNGPIYLYFSHNTTLGEVFETPEFKVHAHMCGSYNKSPKRGHTHLPTENIKKLHGILVMGDPVDYRNPAVQLFTAPVYNYTSSAYENATSVVVFGNEECTLEKEGKIITLKPSAPKVATSPEYCFRAYGEEGANKDDEELFRATAPISVKGCKAKTVPPPAAPAGKKKKRSIRFPMDDEVSRYKRGHRSRRDEPPKVIEMKDCEALPTLEDECKKGKPDPEYACSIFDVMTGTKEAEWEAGSKWRKDVIELIGEIYIQTAPWVDKKFVKLINRLVGFYLVKGLKDAKTAKDKGGAPAGGAGGAPGGRKRRKREEAKTNSNAGPPPPTNVTEEASVGKREVWKFITEELQVCLKRGTRLQFTDEKQGNAKVHLYKRQGETRKIIHMIEEADNDYAFNWVIDAHWKMFATVLGICTPTSRVKQNVISTRFYATYTEDFLSAMSAAWIEYKDNVIFKFILGEFYNQETDAWLNDCLEAAFVESNSESYRPLRPILISEGEEDNYFVNEDVVAVASTTVNPVDGAPNI